MHIVAIPERTEKSIFATKGDSLLYVKHVVADGGIVAKEIKNRSGIGSCSGCEFRGLDFGSEIGNGLHSNALSRAARSGRHGQQATLAMTLRGVGNAFMHSADGTDESVPYAAHLTYADAAGAFCKKSQVVFLPPGARRSCIAIEIAVTST